MSNSRLKAVIFDWDGTLLNSYHADSQAYLSMFRDLDIPWNMALLDQHYSPDWYNVYRAAGIPKARWVEADRLWRTHYQSHKPALMSGVRRVLKTLSTRHQLALVTSGDRRRVIRQLRQFALTGLFRPCICGGDTGRGKPHPAPLLAALDKLRLEPEEAVYVGDTPEDLQMSRAAGVRCISVLGPFPTAQRLRAKEPEYLLDRLQQLPPLLRRLYGPVTLSK